MDDLFQRGNDAARAGKAEAAAALYSKALEFVGSDANPALTARCAANLAAVLMQLQRHEVGCLGCYTCITGTQLGCQPH